MVFIGDVSRRGVNFNGLDIHTAAKVQRVGAWAATIMKLASTRIIEVIIFFMMVIIDNGVVATPKSLLIL